MHAAKYGDEVSVNHEVDGVRESAQQRAPDFRACQRMQQRLSLDRGENGSNRARKLESQAGALHFLPRGCLVDIRFGVCR